MPDGRVTIDDRLLELRDVRLVYNRGKADEVIALRGVDLVAAPGEFLTVIGSNGAGKSSIVQTICGAVRPTSGSVLIGGRDVTRWPDYRRAAFVARVFDDPRIGSAPDLSIEDNLALAMSRGRRHGLRLSLTGARRRVMRDRLARLGLGLEDRLHDRVGLLSAGQRQSLTMVMAGLCAPQVLLLDEHLAALDPATAQRVLALTAELVAEMGSTTIMITHNMEHALEMGTRLLLMSRGRILADLEHKEKTAMTTQGLVDLISRAGDVLGDRTLLSELAEATV
jgi:putative tryptophan/tyrosine transport system ATP-binding protein